MRRLSWRALSLSSRIRSGVLFADPFAIPASSVLAYGKSRSGRLAAGLARSRRRSPHFYDFRRDSARERGLTPPSDDLYRSRRVLCTPRLRATPIYRGYWTPHPTDEGMSRMYEPDQASDEPDHPMQKGVQAGDDRIQAIEKGSCRLNERLPPVKEAISGLESRARGGREIDLWMVSRLSDPHGGKIRWLGSQYP